MPTMKEVWDAWTPPDTLEGCTKLLFEILDSKESNDEGTRDFHPTVINTIRVWDSHRLNKLLPRMKELAQVNLQPNPGHNSTR